MEFSKKSGSPTHKNCANFTDGFCTLYGVSVDPDGATCPNFTSKSPALGPQISHRIHPIFYHATRLAHMRAFNSTTNPSAFSAPSLPIASQQGPAGFISMSSYPRGGRGGGRGRGSGNRGRMGGYAAGPGGSCVCPNCGYTIPHTRGGPCYQQTCPKCGSRLTRGS